MKKIKYIRNMLIVLISIIFFLIFITSCQKSQKGIVKVGVILPLTGPVAEPGTKVLNGIRLAIDRYNQISGNKIKLIIEDSRSDPKSGVSAAQKLIHVDDVKIILGDLMSSVAMAIAPLAQKNKVILFAPGASNPKFPDIGNYIFRNWASDDFDGRVLADYIYENKFHIGAIVYVNNEYGLGLAKAFQARFYELGGSVDIFESYAQGNTDFRPIVAKIKGMQEVQFIYLPGQPIENGYFVKQLREGAVDLPLFANLSVESPEFAKIVGKLALGIVFTSPAYNPISRVTSDKTFQDLYQEAYGSPPDVVAGHGYDAGNILIAALKISNYNLSHLRDSLASIHDFPGVTGNTTFLTNGDVKKDIFVKKLIEPTISEMLIQYHPK